LNVELPLTVVEVVVCICDSVNYMRCCIWIRSRWNDLEGHSI